MEDRIEAAREVMRKLDLGPAWEAALDPDLPQELRAFTAVEEALGRASERRAHGDDDRAAERHGGERAQEAGAEELRPDHR